MLTRVPTLGIWKGYLSPQRTAGKREKKTRDMGWECVSQIPAEQPEGLGHHWVRDHYVMS